MTEPAKTPMRRPRSPRKLCKKCGSKRAIFLFRGRARRDDHHDLCPRCFRSELDRHQAALEASAA